MNVSKPVHSIVLDASPLLINEPSISTLLAKSEKIYTVPQVILEIKDKTARARLEGTTLPFVTIRSPCPASIKVIMDFARRTGDSAVLSSPDIHVLALAYELECEMNHGDWRLRKHPGQKRLNGHPPTTVPDNLSQSSTTPPIAQDHSAIVLEPPGSSVLLSLEKLSDKDSEEKPNEKPTLISISDSFEKPSSRLTALDHAPVFGEGKFMPKALVGSEQLLEGASSPDTGESDSEGWITPSNIKKQQVADQYAPPSPVSDRGKMQVATLTNDFAMQNVLLQMNLNLLSTSLLRIRHLKTYILRCHACFDKTKDMTKQFCPRCGKPTLTRVSCSTDANGEFKLHLKKNMQWNTRGDRFSIPKPISGKANGKVGMGKGGGKGGWGQELILAEDQKEYLQAMTGQNGRKERNLMDDDYLPGILTGERHKAGGRPKVGAGKNINSKKR